MVKVERKFKEQDNKKLVTHFVYTLNEKTVTVPIADTIKTPYGRVIKNVTEEEDMFVNLSLFKQEGKPRGVYGKLTPKMEQGNYEQSKPTEMESVELIVPNDMYCRKYEILNAIGGLKEELCMQTDKENRIKDCPCINCGTIDKWLNIKGLDEDDYMHFF